MGSATVERLTSAEAREERDKLLKRFGLTLKELRSQAVEYQLTAEETARWRRIEELTWLIGE
ncbi:MAG TPA: hypothetical protein VFC82_03745 [Actinomycetaceae bacterium]|nr:hypothetical protein [Actinomycetaceae bacterium]